MALMTRLSRLFVADVHDILDHLEEPAALLRQAIREMEEQVLRAQQAQEALHRERESVGLQIDHLSDELTSTEQKVELAMEAGDANLARDMLRRKLTLEQHAEALRQRHTSQATALERSAEQLADWRLRLEAARQKLSLVETRSQDAGRPATSQSVSEQDVEVAYLAELKKRGGS